MTSNTGQFLAKHEAVLGRLDWWQSKDNKLHYYPKDEFQKAISSFSKIPIVYAKKHPPTGFKGRDLNEVLKSVDGTLAGYTSTAMINNMGSPKIYSELSIIDEGIDTKIKNGELSTSLGFWYTAPDIGSLRDISGDHVLLYDRSLGIPQGDAGAMIVNQGDEQTGSAYYGYIEGNIESDKMVDNEPVKNDLGEVLSLLKQNQDQYAAGLVEKEKKILELNQDIKNKDAEMIKLNQAIADKDKIISDLNTKIEDINKAALEEKKAQFKANQDKFWNNPNLSEGTREHFKDRMGELTDPDRYLQLNQDIMDYELKIRAGNLPKAEGKEGFKGNQGGEEDYQKINEEFKLATGVI